MTTNDLSEAAKAVVRRNTDEVQSGGDFALFEKLFADDFVDHPRSRGARPTRTARDNSTKSCAPHSPTFMVLVAVNWTRLPAALAGLPAWGGRVVIDANNPIEAPLFKPVDLQGRVSSEVFADLVPGARVVKAFNHLRAAVLVSDRKADGRRRVLFYSGNDAAAKAEVAALIERIGFVGLDL